MDNLLGFGRFHHFQIWVVQTVVAILGKEVQTVVCSSKSIYTGRKKFAKYEILRHSTTYVKYLETLTIFRYI